jgi:hypothetical protein
MEHKYLVEECFVLTPKDVGRRWDRIRKLGVNKLAWRSDVSYWFDDMSDPKWLFLGVAGSEPQQLKWEVLKITFGEKQYFYCECGHRASKLYLPPSGSAFKCVHCHNLRYQLSTFSRKSVAGKTLYQMNRMQKLAESRAGMRKILHNGRFSRRFESFLRQCDRAGLDSIVQGANDLKALIAE